MNQTPSPSETALALREPTAPGLPNEIEWGQLVKVSNALAKAQGFIPKHFGGDGYKVLAALMYGRELGFSPMQSLVNIQVIDGKPSLSAHLIAVRVRSAGHSIESTGDEKTCTVTITRGDDSRAHSETFTIEQAKRAGLVRQGSGWEKYPEDMLYARALTRCARRHVPDALEGGAIYATEELEEIEPAPRARVRVIEQEPEPEEAVGAPAEQSAAPVSAEAGKAAPSGELEEEPAQGATAPSGLRPGQVVGIQPFETTLGTGQKVTQYRVHIVTELGERILGPFNTEAEAQRAVETGELPAETVPPEPEPAAPAAAPAAAEPRRKGSRGIAPGMTPPPQPEQPEPTLEQKLEQSVEATARHPMLTSTPPPDPFEAPPAAQPEVQDVMTAAEARLYRIREVAVEIKKIQHDKRGEEIPSEEKLAMEAGQSLDQISKQKYGREFFQLTDDDYQGLLDWLEARLQEAEAA